MQLKHVLAQNNVTLSFEVFPPKTTTSYATVTKAALDVAALKPSYMSVTYGAAGSTRGNTVKIASEIQKQQGVTTIAHLTCVGATRESIHLALDEMQAAGLENVLALRGDKPQNFEGDPFPEFRYASELVREIHAYAPNLCVGGACYPEGHVEAINKKDDLRYLKQKVDAGCDYLTTQMFFDNNIFYNFLYRAREQEIRVPIIPGIMPITRASQVKSAISLSGTNMPERFRNLVDRFGGDDASMMQAGIIYATDQIIDLLANGVNHIHVYSMNKPEVVQGIQRNLSAILRCAETD